MYTLWRILAYLVSIVVVALVATAAQYYTNMSVNSPWYTCIAPISTPPRIVFPVIWTCLYVGMAVALAETLCDSDFLSAILQLTNLGLNILWCYFYFGVRDVSSAFLTINILLAVISLLLVSSSKRLRFVYFPYYIWLLYASFLNLLSTTTEHSCG